jgi:hypothetical protein
MKCKKQILNEIWQVRDAATGEEEKNSYSEQGLHCIKREIKDDLW